MLNNSVDGHLTGIIEYQGKTDTHEVLFGDRDTEDDIILLKGDVAEFNVSTGNIILFLCHKSFYYHNNWEHLFDIP